MVSPMILLRLCRGTELERTPSKHQMSQNSLLYRHIHLYIYTYTVTVSCVRQYCQRDCLSSLLIVSLRVINVSLTCDFQFELAQITSLSDIRQGALLLLTFNKRVLYEKIDGAF